MRGIAKVIRSSIVTGTIVLIPSVLSVFVIYKLFIWLDNVLPSLINLKLPIGLGLIALLFITFITGLVAKNYFGKRIISAAESFIASIPFLNKIYATIQQVVGVLVNPTNNFLGQVVLVEYPKDDSYCLAFVTTRETEEISKALGFQAVCVYVPTTPNPTSGFMLYVPEDKVIDVDLSPEIAIKAIISAGIVSSSKTDTNTPKKLNDLIKRWRTSRSVMKTAFVDPRD